MGFGGARVVRGLIGLAAILAATRTFPAQAYVSYNRLGYVSCAACHFSPVGGGLLTPYGKGVGASMAAISRETSPPEKTLYQGVQLRALRLDSSTRANPFLMQADYLATAYITKAVHADVQAGLNLRQDESDFVSVPPGWDALVLKRAVLSADLDDTRSVHAGRDIPISGLYVTDHTSFLRSRDRRGVYDYTTQLRYLHQTETLQLQPYLLAPSYEESADNREYGLGFRGEYLLTSQSSAGVTLQYANSPALGRLSGGGFVRYSPWHWGGVSAEYVGTAFGVHSGGASLGQHVVHVRGSVAFPDWVETSLIGEVLRVTDPFGENARQFGPSVNVRIHEYVTLIGDGRRVVTSGGGEWSWYGQVFFHLEI